MFRVNFSEPDWLDTTPNPPDGWHEDRNTLIRRTRIDPAVTRQLRGALFKELFDYAAVPAGLRGILALLGASQARRFCELAYRFDQAVQHSGFSQAARQFALLVFSGLELKGFDMIPERGPLVIAANNPGVFAFLALAAGISRSDLKITASQNSFTPLLPGVQKHLIPAQQDRPARLDALRKNLEHLRQGGLLVMFASGRLDPDPAVMTGAHQALANWSPDLALFLERVPELRLQPAIISGVTAPTSLNTPLARLARTPRQRRLVIEIAQTAQRNDRRRTGPLPIVQFGAPLAEQDFLDQPAAERMQVIRSQAGQLLSKLQTSSARA